jgi:hypothetical protein
MVRNVEKHRDDEYKGGKFATYKRMIKDSKKPFYPGCALNYSRLFAVVQLFQMKASHRWSDGSFKELLALLKDMLPQGNTIPETVYEAKQIIYPLGLEVEKIHACKNDCILYRGLDYHDLESALFVDSIDSTVEKMVVMMRTATEQRADLKRCFWYFPIIL